MRYDRILDDLLNRDDFLVVGRSVVRTDALDKVLGRAKFTADYVPRDTAVVKIVRSPHPHALIKGIDASPAMELPGVQMVLTAADIPGENQIGYALPDQPFLNNVKTRFVGDPVALVVAADEGSAIEGVEAVRVKYSPLPSVLDTPNALMGGAPLVHEGGNVALTTKIREGSIERGFSEAAVVVEDLYDTPYQDHMYMEPEAAYAIPEGHLVDPDLPHGDTIDVVDEEPGVVDGLGGTPDAQPAIRLRAHQHRLGLKLVMVPTVRPVGPLDDHISILQGLQVAFGNVKGTSDVALHVQEVVLEVDLLMYGLRIGLHGVQRVE